MKMKQFVVTPSMGKRLIAKAVATRSDVKAATTKGTLVIVAGTTNAYVAQEVLDAVGRRDEFEPRGFRRGMVVPPSFDGAGAKAEFSGDVILVDGRWRKGKEIFDFIDEMKSGDVVIKGANALDIAREQAAVLVAYPKAPFLVTGHQRGVAHDVAEHDSGQFARPRGHEP